MARMAALTGLPCGAVGTVWIAAGPCVAVVMMLRPARRDGAGVVRRSLLHRKKNAPALAARADDSYNPVRWAIKWRPGAAVEIVEVL